MLDKLTDAQIAAMADVRAEWLAHGLSTEPADRDAAVAASRLAYTERGLAEPRIVVWLDSPMAGCMGATMLDHVGDQVWDQVGGQVWGQVRGQVGDQVGDQVRDQVRGQVGGQVWDQVGGQVWGQVRGQVGGQVGGQVRDQVRGQVGGQVWDQVRGQVGDQVWGQVWDQVRGQVGGQVWDQVWVQVGDQVRDQVRGQVGDQVWGQVGGQVRGQVWGQVGGQVRDQVWDQVWDQVGDQVWDQVGDQTGRSMWGQHNAGWYSWIDYWLRHTSITLAATEGLRGVGRAAGWWWAWNGAVLLTDRPETLTRDNLNRLHGETGMAIRYRDGWGFHAWHGLRVPAWVIDRSKPPAEILREPNQEIRRAGIEAYGWDRLIDALNITAVDECPDPGNPGHTLRLVDVPENVAGERLTLVLCSNGSVERDGTRRRYALDVTASRCRRALDAVAWTYDVPPQLYAELAVRT